MVWHFSRLIRPYFPPKGPIIVANETYLGIWSGILVTQRFGGFTVTFAMKCVLPCNP